MYNFTVEYMVLERMVFCHGIEDDFGEVGGIKLI
jgi:hypothetical protein